MKHKDITHTLIKLSNKEIALYKKVIQINAKKASPNNQLILNEIHAKYQDIHNRYAQIACNSIEALKRGLFIQWYTLTEPSYLTGILGLEVKEERKIITELKKRIDQKEADEELLYMLNYYLLWDWVFKPFINIAKFKRSNTEKKIVPNIKTNNRGQMGMYWNSILKQKQVQNGFRN